MNRSLSKPKFTIFTFISLLAMLNSLFPVTSAHAATTTVTNNLDSDPGSLRQAIANAASGDTINFDNDYTITLASQLEIINKTITITGAGHHITISGNNAVRVFHVGQSGGSGNLTLDHLNIVNGASKVDECAGSAVACGGGLMLEYLTTATVLNSTFANNDGGLEGGAIYSYYGNPLTVTNSTFINNHAVAYAGAIGVFYGSAILTNNTFTSNSTDIGYGSTLLNTWGTVTLRNNIFIKGGSVNVCDSDFSDGGSTNDGGGNVRYGDSTCPGTTTTPLLGTSDYYGGDVPTLPLLPGSGAFSAATANCPATDARGIARGTTCDSGAFESQGFTLTKTGGDNQSTPINTAFANPLTLSVTSAFGEPVDGGKATFTSPTSGASAGITGSPVTISGGAASVSATANGIVGGPYNVTASAAGASSSVNFSLTNLKGNTTTSLTSSPNPSNIGQAVTFTATVTTASGVPTGTVTFYDNALGLGSTTLNASGIAALTTTSLAAGTHPTLTVTYGGNSIYNGSMSSNYSHTVNKTNATTSVTSSSNPSLLGQAVTFTATVTSTTGTPTGFITFTLDTVMLTIPLNVNGAAVYVTTTLAVGNHLVSAIYRGDTNFNASSGVLSGGQTVSDVPITGLNAVNDSPTTIRHDTTFTATITAGSNVLYAWDFGDGEIGAGAQVSHRYTQIGTYTATITATNGVGAISAMTRVTIEPLKLYLPLVLRF